ncbi:MAG TPA: SGNH/GDSL hydrolase family protein [Thermodesulfobacteriota bacterium]|nr:SGNH/GDSL hydrolase family protein [Thermodesulfobacteriota bacterium]
MNHIVLLGDSIFDNAAYVEGGPDVRSQLESLLPNDWKVTLLAVDGSTIQDIHAQLKYVPNDASHLIISIGGNDALGYAGFLYESASSVADVLNRLSQLGKDFEIKYNRMLTEVLSHGIPTAVCTIYYPNFPDAVLQRLAVTALTVFNDCIIGEAFAAGIPLIDLRLVCNENADYANPIEPSVKGGEKIARAIAKLVTEHDFKEPRTQVFI